MVVIWSWGKRQLLRRNGTYCWLILLLVCLIFSACGKTAPRQTTLQDLQVRSQERLFSSAKSEFYAARYAKAIQKLRRFLSTYPRSSFEVEVNWLLARSYHESGENEKAVMQYQRVLDHAKAEAYHREARQHMAQLQALSTVLTGQRDEVLALQMTLGQWLQGHDWNSRLKNMARRGVTTQLINLDCGLTKEETAFLFPKSSGIGTTVSVSSPNFSSFVERSHKHGLAVFIGVNVRCLGWLHEGSTIQWADRAYDQGTQAIRSTRYFDVFNPDYQDFLKNALVQLAGSGIDGIVFLSDAPIGMFDGLTPFALAKFQQEFGLSFHPQKVFADVSVVGDQRSLPRDSQGSGVSVPKESEFWRWVGWKARTRLNVLQGLMRTLKGAHPQIQVALEVYAGGLTQPLRTLVQFSEDFLESQRGDFSFLLVDVHEPHPLGTSSSPGNGRSPVGSLPRLAQRFLEITKDPTKIWLTVPRRMEVKTWSSESLKGLTRDTNIPQGIGLVYDLRPFS